MLTVDQQTYSLKKVELNNQWDQFVRESVNGTVFACSQYLKALTAKVVPVFCYRQKELRAAVLLIENENGSAIVSDDLVVYNGVMFAPAQTGQNRAQVLSEQFRVSEFIAQQLMDQYQEIELSLHPSLADIRAWLWIHYGKNLPQYKTDVRYTSYVDISDFAETRSLKDIKIYNEASKSRRQEIRYAQKEGVYTRELFDAKMFVDFYVHTMNRQNIDVNINYTQGLKTVMQSLYEHKLGTMFVSYTSDDQPGSMAFFGFDNKRAYYLFGANQEVARGDRTGTAVLWDAFRILNQKYKIQEVDLEGINSPKRGWFKLSFGGDIRPYYQISKKR